MPILENTPQRLVLRSGSNTLTLDKGSGTGSLQRKMLFWNRKPVELPLSDFTEVKLDAVKDPVSATARKISSGLRSMRKDSKRTRERLRAQA